MNKKSKIEIINDPVGGFITIPKGIIFDLIEHRYFQRLRRIKQLGLTHLVYPGALHNRFCHSIGAFQLMQKAIEVLRQKKVEITNKEEQAVLIAILLHDIGHSPFSHSLENSITKDISHENISLVFMDFFNKETNGQLELAINIFKNKYEKKFLYKLVSSQLDVDRLDYLRRDSFYTGVWEGAIGVERIIKMLNVENNKLVVDYKGTYSVGNYLLARRFMYWQVYFHRTTIGVEQLLIKILKRARFLIAQNVELFASPNLMFFLKNEVKLDMFYVNSKILSTFAALDDYDLLGAVKVWQDSKDFVLSALSKSLINRRLFEVKSSKEEFCIHKIEEFRKKAQKKYNISEEESEYFVFAGAVWSSTYDFSDEAKINILSKDGRILDVSKAEENYHIAYFKEIEKKYFFCYPKEIK